MAVQFDNVADFYSRSGNLLGTGAYTVAMYTRVDTDLNAAGSMLTVDDAGASYFYVGTSGTDGTSMVIDDGNGGVINGANMTVGTWYYMALVYNGTNSGTLYYATHGGGALSSATSAIVDPPSTSVTTRLGTDGYNERFEGSLAHVRIWAAALTSGELELERLSSVAVRTSNLTAAYEWVSPSTTDDSGNGNTLTSNGTIGSTASPSLFVVDDMAVATSLDSVTLTNGGPHVVQSANAAVSSRSPSFTFTSDVAEDDVIVVFPSSGNTATVAMPTGWVNLLGGTTDVESDSHELAGAYHVVTSGEVGQTSWTLTNFYGTAETGDIIAVLLRNIDATAPLDVAASTFDSTNANPHVLAGVTPTVTGGLVLSCIARDVTGTYTVPSGWLSVATSNNTNAKMVLRSDALTTATTGVGPTNITPSGADEYASITAVFVAASAGGDTVTPNDMAVATTLDAVALTQTHNLTVADLAVATTLDNVTLTQTHTLTLVDLAVATTLDAVTISQTHTLAAADLAVATTLDAVTLTQTHTLAVADMSVATTLDNVTLGGTDTVTPDDMAVATTLDAVALTQTHNLTVADMAVATSLDNVTLGGTDVVTPNDMSVPTTLDNVVLVQTHELIVGDLTSATTVDAVVLTQTHTLTVAGVDTATRIDGVTISVTHTLEPADLAVATTLDNVTLVQTHTLAVGDLLVATSIDNLNLGAFVDVLVATVRRRYAISNARSYDTDNRSTYRGDARRNYRFKG